MDNIYYFESSVELYDYMEKHKYEVNEYIYEKIRDYIIYNRDLEFITLFYYEKDGMILKIEIKVAEANLSKPLRNCLEKFEETENYEACTECLNLIEKAEAL